MNRFEIPTFFFSEIVTDIDVDEQYVTNRLYDTVVKRVALVNLDILEAWHC
jgi:hypothetical protein